MKLDEIFHADLTYRADATAVKQRLSVVVADGADGWLGAVYYPDTEESITVCEEAKIEDAKANVEGWVRNVHGFKDAIKWVPGAVSSRELKANC